MQIRTKKYTISGQIIRARLTIRLDMSRLKSRKRTLSANGTLTY